MELIWFKLSRLRNHSQIISTGLPNDYVKLLNLKIKKGGLKT